MYAWISAGYAATLSPYPLPLTRERESWRYSDIIVGG